MASLRLKFAQYKKCCSNETAADPSSDTCIVNDDRMQVTFMFCYFNSPMTYEFDAHDTTSNCVIAEQKSLSYLWTNVNCDLNHRSICVRDG